MLYFKFLGNRDSYDHGQIPSRPPTSHSNACLQSMTSMNSKAKLTTHEEQNPATGFTRGTNSEGSSMRFSETRSENFCYPHHGLEMSIAPSQRSSVTVNMQNNTNEVVVNNRRDQSPVCSLQMHTTEHNRDTYQPKIISHTQPIGLLTTFTGGESNV